MLDSTQKFDQDLKDKSFDLEPDSSSRPLHVIGLREAVRLVRRRMTFIASFVIAVMLLLAVVVSSMENTYTATSELVLERNDTEMLEAVTEMQGAERDRSAIETEMDIITSRVFAGRVVDALGLVKDPLFNYWLPGPVVEDDAAAVDGAGPAADGAEPAADGAAPEPDAAAGGAGQPVDGATPDARTADDAAADGAAADDAAADQGFFGGLFSMFSGGAEEPAPDLPDPDVQRDAAISSLLSMMAVTRSGESLAVSVHVSTPDPKLSARIANTVAEVYVDWSRELKQKAMTDAVNYLRDRAAQIAERIAKNERDITDFSRQNDLASDERDDTLRQRIDQVNTQLTTARIELASLAASRDQGLKILAGTQDLDTSALDSPLLTTLRSDRARAEGERAQAGSNLGPNHPATVNAQAQIASIDKMIHGEIQRLVEELAAKQAVTEQRTGHLEMQLSTLQASLRQRALAEIRLRELERDLLANQKLHDLVVARLGSLDPYAEITKPSARLVSVAAVPTSPSFPQKDRLFFGGVVGSVVLAIILALMLEAVDTRVRSGQRIMQVTRLANLANIPRVRRGWFAQGGSTFTDLIGHPHSVYAESMRSLYLACRTRLPAVKPVVLFASPMPRDGATSVSLGFAVSAARDGIRTILVDLDPRRPEVASVRFQTPGPHLEDVFAGTCSVQDAIRPVAGMPLLDVITVASQSGGRNGSQIRSDSIQWLIEELRRTYDMIVIDCAPVLVVETANWLSLHVDAVMLVARYGSTSEQSLAAAVARLRVNRAPLTGTVLNAVDPSTLSTQDSLGAISRRQLARSFVTE